jgi:hypothetical protein
MILISLSVATVISMAIMALILMAYGNKQEEFVNLCKWKLVIDGEILEVIPPEKKLQIVS